MSTVAERAELLATIPLFAGLRRKQLATIAESAHIRRVARFTKLISQGEAGESCFVILEGRAEVRHDSNPVAELARGAVFGELALLDGGARIADVTMITAGEVLEVHRSGFDELLAESPEAARTVLTQLAARLRESERQRFSGARAT